jgi:hypothetical protein
MQYQGTVHNGVVVFNGDPPLPEGAVVRVIPLTGEAKVTANGQELDPLFCMSELAVPTGLPDLAANADQYLNGRPGDDHAG